MAQVDLEQHCNLILREVAATGFIQEKCSEPTG
jgi:phage FluMu protein Com